MEASTQPSGVWQDDEALARMLQRRDAALPSMQLARELEIDSAIAQSLQEYDEHKRIREVEDDSDYSTDSDSENRLPAHHFQRQQTLQFEAQTGHTDEALAWHLQSQEYPSGVTSNEDEALARSLQHNDVGFINENFDEGGDTDTWFHRIQRQMEIDGGSEPTEQAFSLHDPLWGEIEAAEGLSPRPHHVVCFVLCPCCAGTVCVRRQRGFPPVSCAPSKCAALERINRTMCFWLSLVQVQVLYCVGIALCEHWGFG